MARSILLLLILTLLYVFCAGQGEFLKIRIVDREDEDPKVSATVVNKNSDRLISRRLYSLPSYRNNVRESASSYPFGHHKEIYDPYLSRAKYHGSTVFSQNELKESLGSLVNSILMSRMKHPVNKIYIFSRNTAELPHTEPEPVYQVYDQHGPGQPFASPLVQAKGNDQFIRPDITPAYRPTSAPLQISRPAMEDEYHLPAVTESVEDYSPEMAKNYAQDLKEIQKSFKKVPYKAPFPTAPRKKPSSILNERAKLYADFMKSREYFLPKLEPDHHTEQPVSIYFPNKNYQKKQPLHYELGQGLGQPQRYDQGVRPGVVQSLGQGHRHSSSGGQGQRLVHSQIQIQAPQIQIVRKQPALQHHAFTTQNIEFTADDAIRGLPAVVDSDEDDDKFQEYSGPSFTSKLVNSDSDVFTKEDSIRLLESRRYTVPRDCSTLCLEQNSKNYDPVCGSDGRTYLNENMLNCLSACRSKDTEMDSQGPCN